MASSIVFWRQPQLIAYHAQLLPEKVVILGARRRPLANTQAGADTLLRGGHGVNGRRHRGISGGQTARGGHFRAALSDAWI
mmetsp:Transcript_38102/g.68967  ORF Transcript_38102/g.68967 Transcript_38102/m.68967 type:complete len:81 (+) Transcript_38102:1275-1517(+)